MIQVGEISAPDPHVHHLDAVACGLVIELLADPTHQFFPLIAHHLDKGDFAQHAPQGSVQKRGELEVGSLD